MTVDARDPSPVAEGSRAGSRERARRWPMVASTVARLIMGCVWLWAGIAKLSDLDTSVQAVREYQLLPDGLETFTGHALPVVEVAIGLLLLTGLYTRAAAIGSSVLLVGFIVGMASAQARGLAIRCGCFGGTGGESGVSKATEIARDVALLVASLWLVWRPRSYFAADWLRGGAVGAEPWQDALDGIDEEAGTAADATLAEGAGPGDR